MSKCTFSPSGREIDFESGYRFALGDWTGAMNVAYSLDAGHVAGEKAVTGLLWLSTIPPTSGLVALMFGTRWLAMLFGFAFFSHQVGGFLGVWLGGFLFERTGSYDVVWWLSVFFGVASALINLPIVEKPVQRLAPARA